MWFWNRILIPHPKPRNTMLRVGLGIFKNYLLTWKLRSIDTRDNCLSNLFLISERSDLRVLFRGGKNIGSLTDVPKLLVLWHVPKLVQGCTHHILTPSALLKTIVLSCLCRCRQTDLDLASINATGIKYWRHFKTNPLSIDISKQEC